MNYHPVLVKGPEIVVGRKALAMPQRRTVRKKEDSRLCRTGHHSYPIEPLPYPDGKDKVK